MPDLVRTMIPGMDLHVDGDYCAYYYAGNDETTLTAAKHNMLDSIRNVATVAGAGGRRVVHITAGGSDKAGRYDIATVKPYQGHRGGGSKPKNWEGMRLWLEGLKIAPDIHIKVWHDREADDGVAWAARYSWLMKQRPAILARDKDFRMIPGRHIDWTTWTVYDTDPSTFFLDTGEVDSNGPVFYGSKFFWKQMLMGDTADHIPGLEKIILPNAKGELVPKDCGQATASKVLEGAADDAECFRRVRDAYKATYALAWADRFAEQAGLLWLRTDKDADPANFLTAIPMVDQELPDAIRRMKARIT